MNRKGVELAILLLPLIALVFSGLALFLFISFSGEFKGGSGELDIIIADSIFAKRYVIAEAKLIAQETIASGGDLEKKFLEIAGEKDLNLGIAGNFFGKIRNNEFNFDRLGENYILEVDDLFVKSEIGKNSIKKNFDLLLEFDSEGKVLRRET